MNITVIGAGNSGLAMAAHLSQADYRVILWNRSRVTIAKHMETLGYIAASRKPFEPNVPHHFAFRRGGVTSLTLCRLTCQRS